MSILYSDFQETANLSSDWNVTEMSKREYFAGLALQGLCANINLLKLQDRLTEDKDLLVECSVGLAIALADELITQLH